jgi:hypothetical protein
VNEDTAVKSPPSFENFGSGAEFAWASHETPPDDSESQLLKACPHKEIATNSTVPIKRPEKEGSSTIGHRASS